MSKTVREQYEFAVKALKDQADLIDAGKADHTSLDAKFSAVARAKAALEDTVLAKMTALGDRAMNGIPGAGTVEGGNVSTGESIGSMLLAKGFDLKSKPSVELSAMQVLNKANVWPTAAQLAPRQPDGVVAISHDRRWLWPQLRREDAGTNTAIEDFKQTAVAVTGAIERAIDATTDKAALSTTVAFVVESLKQWAVTCDSIPNAVLESVPLLTAFIGSEARFQIENAIDTSCVAAITAAGIPFGTTGADLVAKLRNAISAMRAVGANPAIAVLNPTDSAALDLLADAGGYVFIPPGASNAASPLFGLTIVEHMGTVEPPLLIDPALLGVLYLGTMRFDADPYTGFKKNLTTLRVEINGLMHVRNPLGAYRVAAT